MTEQTASTARGPAQGPAAPTHTDLIWATASSAAALADERLTPRERQACLEAECATYTAAVHLGVAEGGPVAHSAELAQAELAAGVPTLTEWVAVVGEPEAGL
jgi:hypothetical protein